MLVPSIGQVPAQEQSAPAAPPEEMLRLRDFSVRDAVLRRLARRPEVPHQSIDVEVASLAVKLSGTVETLLAKRRAEEIAQRVKGVEGVVNEIDVEPAEAVSDEEVSRRVQQALLDDPVTQAWQIDVSVEDGVVTLTGDVDSWTERNFAKMVAAGIAGVKGVENELLISPRQVGDDEDIEAEVRRLLRFNTRVDAGMIDVEVDNGRVTLTGTVASAREREIAKDFAGVAGVTAVDVSGLGIQWWKRQDMVQRPQPPSPEETHEAIREALRLSPELRGKEVEIAVTDGVVTLSGEVNSLSAKREATRLASEIEGVNRVVNDLVVEADKKLEEKDEEVPLDRRVQTAFGRDAWLSDLAIQVRANDGVLTLEGTVDYSFQADRAREVASNVDGVREVVDRLSVEEEKISTRDVILEQDIESDLFWTPTVDVDEVTVEVENGTATLRGTVESWAESNEAVQTALEAGATRVVNRLEVR